METWSAFSFWEIPHFVRDFGRRAPARQSAARSRLLNARCEASVAFSRLVTVKLRPIGAWSRCGSVPGTDVPGCSMSLLRS